MPTVVYIMDRNNEGTNPDTLLLIGDIVTIIPDCVVNVPPAAPFRIIKLIDINYAQAFAFFGEVNASSTTRKRVWTFDTAKLTTGDRNKWNSLHYLELTNTKFKRCLRNKSDGSYAG